MVDFITHLAPGLLYPAIFVGIIFLGGLMLLPAMYLSMNGLMSVWTLFALTLLAGIVADTIWYVIGASAKKERMYALPFVRKRVEEAKAFSAFFQKHGALLVFAAKFVYGTRIASHVLAGMHRIHFAKFIGAVISGTAVWFGVFYFLLRSVDMGVSAAQATTSRIRLIFLVLTLVLIAVNWFTGSVVRRKMMKGSKRSLGKK